MGDPCLIARDPIINALFDSAGPQRPEVGAGVGLCKDRRRQRFGGGQLWQPLLFLFFSSTAQDQFRRDLGARA